MPERAYVARLETEDGAHQAWIVFELAAAIAAAGLLVMRQDSVIKKLLGVYAFEGDDFDAMGEFLNQIVPAFNDAIHQATGSFPRFGFKEGSINGSEQPETTDRIIVVSEVTIGELASGTMFLVVPSEALGVEEEVEAPKGTGLELTPEEVAAIREATRDAKAGRRRTLIVVPIERERARWTEMLDGAGFDYEFATELASVGRHVRSGEFSAVIVDADSCPAGGLTVLAVLRNDPSSVVPAFVVASSPTRSHLLSCVAAGAKGYVTKPFEAQALIDTISAS